jgi:hypothetical protein
VPGRFTRTPGFYKNRPAVTQAILDAVGGIDVCGIHIDNTDVDSETSAIEAMCGNMAGDGRRQLIRSLTAATLTGAAGGANFAGLGLCNVTCVDPNSSKNEISACIGLADAFNESGDNLAAPFGGGAANPGPCQAADNTKCKLDVAGSCTNP